MKSTAAPTYPVATIAKLLLLSDRRVQQLTKEGVIPKEERGRYELAPADVWEYARVHKTVHSCEKPVGLIEEILDTYHKNSTVLDLFGGSTLIACEKTNRQARLMELDPKYCDVVVKRWQEFTGKMAVHAETGEPFAEVTNGN